MATDLPLGQVVDLTIAFEDVSGNPAIAPGSVVWVSGTPATATIAGGTPDTTAIVTALAEGDTEITATSGGISATFDITVIAGIATQATISAGTPHAPA